MVHFPPLPSPSYVFTRRYGGITRRGFPHSEIPGSKLICSSPRLIAAYRVLHRLPAPRHSPYALSSLSIGIKDDPEAPLHWDNWSISSSHPHTHCVRYLWFRKNYRLQNIQLSKTRTGALPPQSKLAPPPKRRLVENTGIEPVTSWLQTRRSPS